MKQPIPFIASCLILGIFYSCTGPDYAGSTDVSSEDPGIKTIQDPVCNSNTKPVVESVKKSDACNAAPEKIKSLLEVNRRLNKKATHFVIKTNRDTVIKCKEGTLLSIPANAFLDVSTQKPLVGEVRISVREFYKISDMLIAGLTTRSDGKLLETGGMINIKARNKENNDSCILSPGKSIIIAMASSGATEMDRMQLFNGAHNNTDINWVPRSGLPGLALGWTFGRNNLAQEVFQLDPEFIFPDEILNVKPLLIKSKPEQLQSEIEIPLRDLLLHNGLVTKKAYGYIDTSGTLHCYKIGYRRQKISFSEIYRPTIYQDLKVNLAVDMNLSYRSNLNHDYYQKLFKMGKGNPDSLVSVTATLSPAIKITDIDKIEKIYGSVVTVSDYQKKQRRQARLIKEYEKRMEQLRLDSEERLTRSENNSSTSLQNAQNYLLLNTSQLGWINCDRFYNAPAKVDYIVKLNERASLLIVFNSIKAIMSSDANGTFQSVPLNEKITLVGLKTENGKLMMACHETTVTERPFEGLNFKAVTVKEYKSQLEKLNRL